MPNDQPDYTSVVARPQTQLAGSPWVIASSGTHTLAFTLTPDTSILAIMVPALTVVTEITVTGVVSGSLYLDVLPSTELFPNQFYAIVQSAVDTSVNVTVVSTTGTTVYVSSIPDPVAQTSLVTFPAPWEAPNQPPLHMGFGNPGTGAHTTIIPAPAAGKSIWLHELSYNVSGTNAALYIYWQTSDGTVFAGDICEVDIGRRHFPFRGARLGAGLSVQVMQPPTLAANTIFYEGTAVYSVY